MSIHREAVEQNRLFEEFDKLRDFERVSKSDIGLLKGMVLDVAEKAGPHLDLIKLTFHQYTQHDIQHLLNIADHIHSFLPRRARGRGSSAIGLNAVELTYIWLAILLHDAGMFVSQAAEKQEILDLPDYKEFLRHHRNRMGMAQQAESSGRPVTARAIEDALFAEFIRRKHAERVHNYISEHLSGRLRFREVDLSLEVGKLCESHNWGVWESRDARQPHQCVARLERKEFVGPTRVNLAYLACCLRLGDILDFDRSRTPLSAFHQIHFTETLSVQEWNKHLSITGIQVSEYRVEYVAKCTTPADYVAVHQFLDWVDRELQESTRLIGQFPQQDAARYKLNLTPLVDRHQVRMANPNIVAGGFRFQLEYERIMQLLMDKSLYPDETLFLRELLQNALDACRYKRALAQDQGMQDKYIPRIQVWDYSASNEGPHGWDNGPRIVFSDNGVGMSLHQVENYFMRVGKSFYTSPEFQAERERLSTRGIHLDACSQFGIGFLSCFLGGDRIQVETYRDGSEPLRITIDGPSKYFVIERLPRSPTAPIPFNSPSDPLLDMPSACSGTTIKVFLRDGWRENPPESQTDLVFQTLDGVAVNQDIPIFIVDSTFREPRVLAASRWDGEPIGTPDWSFYRPTAILPHIIPSPFALAEFDARMRGQGFIWLFRSDSGTPVPLRGDLVMSHGNLSENRFIRALRSLLVGGHLTTGLPLDGARKALEDLRANPEDYSMICGQLNELYNNETHFKDADILALSRGDIDWAIEVARELPIPRTSHGRRRWRVSQDVMWGSDVEEVSALLAKDRDGLARRWYQAGVAKSWIYDIRGKYQLALFGIDSPGGFQTWDVRAGSARRDQLVPNGVSLRVDSYGDLAPKPAASRLYVPFERSEAVRGAITRAFLLHARRLWNTHGGCGDWSTWYEEFICEWDVDKLPTLLTDSDIRDLWTEFRDRRPKARNRRFYITLGAMHSPFGRIVMSGNVDPGTGRFDPFDPQPQEVIRSAALKAGLAASQIEDSVGSLSKFLGWDITKGHP